MYVCGNRWQIHKTLQGVLLLHGGNRNSAPCCGLFAKTACPPPPPSVLLPSSHAAQRVLVLFRHNSLSLQLPQCRQVKDLIGKMSSPFSYHMNVSESECERARLESSNRGRCGTCCSVAAQREFVFARAKVGHWVFLLLLLFLSRCKCSVTLLHEVLSCTVKAASLFPKQWFWILLEFEACGCCLGFWPGLKNVGRLNFLGLKDLFFFSPHTHSGVDFKIIF